MLRPLAHPAYRRLFGAQVVALVGTGLTTVALALLAYVLAGEDAGAVVGIALAEDGRLRDATGRCRLRPSRRTASPARRPRPRARRRGDPAALRRPGLAGLRADPRAQRVLGGLPVRDPGRPGRRALLHPRAVAVAFGLRARKPAQPGAGGAGAGGDQLRRALRGQRGGVPGLGTADPLGRRSRGPSRRRGANVRWAGSPSGRGPTWPLRGCGNLPRSTWRWPPPAPRSSSTRWSTCATGSTGAAPTWPSRSRPRAPGRCSLRSRCRRC